MWSPSRSSGRPESCDRHQGEWGTFEDTCGGTFACECEGGALELPEGACGCTPGRCGSGSSCVESTGLCEPCSCADDECGELPGPCAGTICPKSCSFPETCGGGGEPGRCGCGGQDGAVPCEVDERPYCWEPPTRWAAARDSIFEAGATAIEDAALARDDDGLALLVVATFAEAPLHRLLRLPLLVVSRMGFVSTDQGTVTAFRRPGTSPDDPAFAELGLLSLDDPGDGTDQDRITGITLGCDGAALLYGWDLRHRGRIGIVELLPGEPPGVSEPALVPPWEAGPVDEVLGTVRTAGETPGCNGLYLVGAGELSDGQPGIDLYRATRRHCP